MLQNCVPLDALRPGQHGTVAQLRLRHVVQRDLTGGRVIGGFHGVGASFLGMDAAYCCGV